MPLPLPLSLFLAPAERCTYSSDLTFCTIIRVLSLSGARQTDLAGDAGSPAGGLEIRGRSTAHDGSDDGHGEGDEHEQCYDNHHRVERHGRRRRLCTTGCRLERGHGGRLGWGGGGVFCQWTISQHFTTYPQDSFRSVKNIVPYCSAAVPRPYKKRSNSTLH